MKNFFVSCLIIFALLSCSSKHQINDSSKDNPLVASNKKSDKIVKANTKTNSTNNNDSQTKSNSPSIATNKTKSSYSGQQVAIYSLYMLEIGYTFGGKNPEAGLDCSGLVTYVFKNAVDRAMSGNAATIATRGKVIPLEQIRTGDLVFFNTTGKPYSHVGIYLGNNHFIHAPNSRSQVRVDKLSNSYWRAHLQEVREYFDD